MKHYLLRGLSGTPVDMTQYIKHSLATAVSDFLVASGAGVFVKKTLAEVKTILGLGTAAYTAATDYVTHALATAANDFLVASGSGAFVKKTLAETLTVLGKAAASGLASLNASTKVVEQPASISDHLDDTAGGTDAEVTKAPTSNVMYDHGVLANAHGAVATATASKIVVRDASARAAFAAPSAAGDAAILSTVTDHAALTTGVHGVGSNYLLSTGDISRKNAIINGIGIVNQRVTAYTLAKDVYNWDVNNLTGPDRFEGMATGTLVTAGTFSNNLIDAVTDCHTSFQFLAVTLTGTGIIYFRYRVEAKDSLQFVNKTASFKCYVYQNTGGAINYTIYVRKANAADNFSAVTAIGNSGAISVPTTTTTSLPYLAIAMGDCSNGIEIEIKVECGAITTKTFYFTELQLELGSVATPFEFRPYGQELALCQRYFQKMIPGVANGVYGAGVSVTTTISYLYFVYLTKRTVPAVTASAADDFTIWYSGGAQTATTAMGAGYMGPDACFIQATTAAVLTAGQGAILMGKNSTTHFITVDAEL